jgi:Ala-tRNA(Pro) deacylase
MSISRRLKEYLEHNKVAYRCIHHAPAFTAQDVAASEHVPGREVAKTVVVKIDDNYVLVVLPATMKIDLPTLREVMPFDQVAIATESEFERLFPDSEPGAMPPFGNLYGLGVFVDRSLENNKEIVFNAGTHIETVRMKYADFERLVEPVAIDVAVPVQVE